MNEEVLDELQELTPDQVSALTVEQSKEYLRKLGLKSVKPSPWLNTEEWRWIAEIAQINGITLKQPDPSCKKCMGRGYVGKESHSKTPIACNCIIFSVNDENPMLSRNIYRLKNINSKK